MSPERTSSDLLRATLAVDIQAELETHLKAGGRVVALFPGAGRVNGTVTEVRHRAREGRHGVERIRLERFTVELDEERHGRKTWELPAECFKGPWMPLTFPMEIIRPELPIDLRFPCSLIPVLPEKPEEETDEAQARRNGSGSSPE